MKGALHWARARAGILAIVAIGISWGSIMHSMGWAQLGHYAEVRALADGRKDIDPWHWETGDVAYIDGHYYSVKSPGTAALSTLPYLAIEGLGGLDLAADAAANAAGAGSPRWTPDQEPPFAQYGYNADRAQVMQERIEDGTPVVWALTLLVAVIPSILLLLGVRWLADRLEPGFGTAAAVTLGLATILSTYAAEFFSHAISTAIAFAAFAVLLHERAGPSRPALVAAAGLLAGLAVTFEVQVGLVGVVLFGLAIAREGRVRRGAAYAAGAVAGALPHLAFNWWVLGSPLAMAYGDAVARIGVSGHDEIGLNDDGFFGITLPRLDGFGEVLIGGRGLLVLTPVLAMAVVGTFIMYRRGRRVEALTIGAVALAYLLYNAAYWQPLGGGTPGPRFMTPVLPFLALGLAFAYRSRPATTLALAVPSLLWMLVANLTYPLLGYEGSVEWLERLVDGQIEHTVLAVLGLESNWLALAPVLLAMAGAVAFAVVATPWPRPAAADLRLALAALGGWAALFVLGPWITNDPVTVLDGGAGAMWLVLIAAALALCVLAALRYRGSGQEPGASLPRDVVGPALGERTS
jgi:hypothetical protein